MAVSEPLLPTTTVSFSVIQFNSSQTPFVAFANVPIAAFHEKDMRSYFGAMKN